MLPRSLGSHIVLMDVTHVSLWQIEICMEPHITNMQVDVFLQP